MASLTRKPPPFPTLVVHAVDYDGHFQPVDAFTRLFPHAATLTSLHFKLRTQDAADSLSHHSQDVSSEATHTTLAGFLALKHVFLSADAVCKEDRSAPTNDDNDGGDDEDDQLLTRLLPPNIESLCLAGPRELGEQCEGETCQMHWWPWRRRQRQRGRMTEPGGLLRWRASGAMPRWMVGAGRFCSSMGCQRHLPSPG
ncbi:hypothetical protein N657DRAFT_153883 [Parathielavia appendiculata]|uniref:Uncharacterized protein n=1 Tax=Parathielavia appendiculata TaxID=2587402 RepID=A0AAN6Z0U2_9PEZI|nr:hypothetical protein N657DRAFT_153883 [Parathielavia appendiculata]